MKEILLLENIERYLNGEMSVLERSDFEQLRIDDANVNKQIEQYELLFKQLQQYNQQHTFRAQLQKVHNAWKKKSTSKKMHIVYLWNKYKRTVAVAAVIAGFTAFITVQFITYVAPKAQRSEVQELVHKVKVIEDKQTVLGSTIERATKDNEPSTPVLYNGTGFLIDVKGYLITSAHVVKNTKNIRVQNSKGEVYNATILHVNNECDLAILKINDDHYKPINRLPYTIRKNNIDLGEQVFTLGYPRNEIVYGEGYASATTGYNGDTLSCQLAISANPGNSGGPILNKNGEIVGVLNARQLQVDGVVFAIRSINIYNLLNALKQNETMYDKIRLPTNYTSFKKVNQAQQINRVKDCVFMIKVY